MIKNILILMCLSIINLLSYPGLMAQSRHHAGPSETRIVYKADTKIFPRKWRNEKIKPEISLIAQGEITRMQEVMETALAKYPLRLLRKNLKTIYILKTMFFFGMEYGGTYYKRKVYITNNGIEHGYTNQYIEGTFHHEFSSVLLVRHTKVFNSGGWLDANPSGFSYKDGGVAALKAQETNLKLDTTLFEKGFLNEYSLASLEEDLNCYAEYIFLGDSGFWMAWEESKAIRRKTGILIDFYHSIDPIFTLEYFKRLAAK